MSKGRLPMYCRFSSLLSGLIPVVLFLGFIAALPTSLFAQNGSEMSDSGDDQNEEVGDDSGMEQQDEEQDPLQPDLSQSLLFDMNGDGVLTVDAFGDSLTRGTGDFNNAGESIDFVTTPSGEAGYPLRVELSLGVQVSNLGSPGERLTTSGIFRFASIIPARRPDIVLLSGGSNDAFDFIDSNEFSRALQTMINIARANGVQVVLLSLSPVCCDRSGLAPFIDSYSDEIALRARVNDLPLADIDKAYRNTCSSSRCTLLNIPEGLHPNSVGYDVNGEVVAATLLGIDIFNPLERPNLAAALGTVPEAFITVPDPLPPAVVEN